MKNSILVFIIIVLSCNNYNGNNFIDNFYIVKKESLVKNLIIPENDLGNKNKKLMETDYELLNYFQIPIDELYFKESYSPGIKNRYEFVYRCKIKDNFFLISYIQYYGPLNDYEQYLCVYDEKRDQVISKLCILTSAGLKTIANPQYDGEIFKITTTYKYNLEHGLDLPEKDRKPKEIIESYKLNNFNHFEKIK